MNPILKNPPFLEAFCEFHFASDDWDWAIPGIIYNQIGDEFKRREQHNSVEFVMAQGPDGTIQPVPNPVQRVRFIKPDGSALVQVGPNYLAINRLPPYQDWEEYKPLIERILSIYVEKAKPSQLLNVGVRYINCIRVRRERYQIEDYLNTMPQIPDSRDQTWLSWAQNVEILKEELEGKLIVQSGTIVDPADSSKRAVMLDLSFVTLRPGYVPLENVSSWLDSAHKEIEDIFFASLTPKAIEMFQSDPKEEVHE